MTGSRPPKTSTTPSTSNHLADRSTTVSAAAPATSLRIPRSVTVSAWAAPLMVVGDFALLAVVPVALVLSGALRDTRLRSLRWPAALLAAVYTTPLAIWLLRPDGAQSLSKDIHPGFVVLILAASVLVLLRLRTIRR